MHRTYPSVSDSPFGEAYNLQNSLFIASLLEEPPDLAILRFCDLLWHGETVPPRDLQRLGIKRSRWLNHLGVSKNNDTPQIIHFNRGFP